MILYKAIFNLHTGFNHLKRLHQIPCSKCIYFTGDDRLKCPVNPVTALSEQAISCRDFKANSEFNFPSSQNSQVTNPSKSLT